MRRFTDLLLRYPRSFLFILALATLAVGSAGTRTEFDASLKSFILDGDPDYALYNEYRQQFGQDEILVIAFEDEDVFTNENLALVDRLTKRIEDLDNIYDVHSLSNAEYMKSTPDSFEAEPLIEEIPSERSALAESKRIALDHEIFRKDLVSEDGRKTSILVTFAAMEEGYKYESEIAAVQRIVDEEAAISDKTLHLSGERYIDKRFLKYIHDDLEIFIPLTCIALALLLYAMFRRVRETVIGLIAISACLLWIGGLIPLTGWKMNSVIAGLPSLVMCIAVTDVIHIIHRYRSILPVALDRERAVRQTIRETALPCFLTSLTTGVGFGSLVMNAVTPIKGFGFLAALGILLCFPICIICVPALLWLWKEPTTTASTESVASPGMATLTAFLIRRKKAILSTVAAALLIAAAGIFAIRVQVDRVRYLKESSDIYQAVDFVDNKLAGTTQLDVWIEGGVEGAVKEPHLLNKVEGLVQYLREQPEITKVISINDFLKEMNKAFYAGDKKQYVLPTTRENIAQFLLIYSMSGRRNEVDKYVDYPYSRTRVSVRTDEHNSAHLDGLMTRMNEYLADNFKAPYSARLASVAVPNNNVFNYLLRGLLVGLGTAVLVVGLIMCLTFRSIFVGLVSMIPNILPIVMCLGLMGWTDVWLEIATAMTFSIALGIAVDDTIHFLSRFRLELNRYGDHERAMRATLDSIGWALIKTTTVIMGGFLVLLFASLKMNITFGLLAAFIMLITLVADLFVTPVCLLVFKPFNTRPEAPEVREHEPALAGSSD